MVLGIMTAETATIQNQIRLFDKVLFYDGYATAVSAPVPTGVIRHRNDLYAIKLTDAQLASIGSTLTMNVTLKAACDNYDRIGNGIWHLCPKGRLPIHPTMLSALSSAGSSRLL